MSERVLVTGFDSFGRLQRPNASSELVLPAVSKKYGDLVTTLTLPTTRNTASEQLLEEVRSIEPAAIVMFGIRAGRSIRLEQRARNWNYNVLIPDNEGRRAVGPIVKSGASTQAATLPLDTIYDRLQSAGVPTKMSRHAGTFVCNEVMYQALSHAQVPTGFVHLGNGMPSQTVEEASILVVDEVLKHTGTLL